MQEQRDQPIISQPFIQNNSDNKQPSNNLHSQLSCQNNSSQQPNHSQQVISQLKVQIQPFPIKSKNQVIACIYSQEITKLHYGLILFNNFLFETHDEKMILMVSQHLQRIISLAKTHPMMALKMEANQILSSFSEVSAAHCQLLIQKGAIDVFLGFLSQKNIKYQERQYKGQQSQVKAVWKPVNLYLQKEEPRLSECNNSSQILQYQNLRYVRVENISSQMQVIL